MAIPLQQVRIAAPCRASWSQMEGDQHVRRCQQCDKHVYNLSSLTKQQAESLIEEHHGSLCVRYYQRHDGTVLAADCPIGVVARTRRRIASCITALSLMLLLAAETVGLLGKPTPTEQVRRMKPFAGVIDWLEPSNIRGQVLVGSLCTKPPTALPQPPIQTPAQKRRLVKPPPPSSPTDTDQ